MPSPQAALIHAMVAAADAPDGQTIGLIGDLVDHLPIFRGIDRRLVAELAQTCSERLARPGGRDALYGEIRAALPGRLREAAYALSCDVIASGCRLQADALPALERVRMQLEVDPVLARTIERVAKTRREAA